MPKTRPPYPPEFRAEAIRLLRVSGKPVAQLARELDVSSETLRLWRKQADLDDGLRHDGLTTEETEEVRRLRREVTQLREEREILVKVPMPRRGSTADGNRGRWCDTPTETARAA